MSNWQVLFTFLGLFAIDWVLGILTALKAGEGFSLQKLPKQVEDFGRPLIATVSLAIAQSYQDAGAVGYNGLLATAIAVAGASSLRLASDIIGKAGELTGLAPAAASSEAQG